MTSNMNTGSDTRLYAPRSESNLGYTKDDEDFVHGMGDAESMEQMRDKRMKDKENEPKSNHLPHLVIDVPNPPPKAPEAPPPEMPEDEPAMDDQNENAVGAEVSQMTGMPDTGNLSIGNATGTKPGAGGQLINMGEPMENAWSELMKDTRRLDKVKAPEHKPWSREKFRVQPGGRDISTATSRRSKLHSRYLAPSKEKGGLTQEPLSVHRSHLGISTNQPMKLFPRKYQHQMGTMARRKLMGSIPQAPAGHGLSGERMHNPHIPKPPGGGGGLNIRAPSGPRLMGQSLAKSDMTSLKDELEVISKKMNYMHMAQMRRLLRKVKDAMENKERRLKAAVSGGPGENRESGHREGADGTTRPEGATENLDENDNPQNWGAPATLFAAKGSGRVA